MAENNQTLSTLGSLLDYDARRFASSEIQLGKSMPQWIIRANSLQLKIILKKYLDHVLQHVRTLNDFFEQEKITPLGVIDKVMSALIEETDERLSDCTDAETRDACLLARIQSINHFKICSYGTAAAFANVLEKDKAAAVFHGMEINEKQIDDRLSQLALYEINIKAKAPIVLPG